MGQIFRLVMNIEQLIRLADDGKVIFVLGEEKPISAKKLIREPIRDIHKKIINKELTYLISYKAK